MNALQKLPLALWSVFFVNALVMNFAVAEDNFPLPLASFEGDKVPGFEIQTIDAVVITSEALTNRPYVVNFFASWCPRCREEMPGKVRLQQKYAEQGFTFIGIAYKDTEVELSDFLWEMGVNYPVAMANPELEAIFGHFLPGGRLKAVPASFVVGRDGRLINVVNGGLVEKDFESLIVKAIGTRPKR